MLATYGHKPNEIPCINMQWVKKIAPQSSDKITLAKQWNHT
jgi:hypothetical protein